MATGALGLTHRIWIAALLGVATLAVYVPAIQGDFVWDDDQNVTANANLRDLAGLKRIWTEAPEGYQYYPLTHTTFWIEHQLWGLRAPALHATNVVLHAACAVLLWILLSRLRVPGALLAAGMFALHPVNVESVAWITERKNVLCGVLALSSTLAYLRFARLPGIAPHGVRRGVAYALALTAFACALCAKTAIAPLPVVLLLLVAWKRQGLRWPDVLPVLPFFLLAVGFGLLTWWLEVHHLGAGRDWDLSPTGRLIVAGRAVWFYAGKLVWPFGLMFFYPRWEIDPAAAIQYAWPLAALAVPVPLCLARRRLGSGPLVAVLCYAALLAPVLGFLDVYFFAHAFVQDHFQYFASMALLPLLAAAATRTLERAARSRALRIAAAVLLLGALGGLSWQRAHVFENWETLFRDTLASNPGAWGAHHNLGNWLVGQARVEEGLVHLKEAVRLYSQPTERAQHSGSARLAQAGSLRLAALRYSVADSLMQLGRLDEAAAECEWILRIAPASPRAHHKLADISLRQGKAEAAARHLEAAVRLAPDSAELYADLARAHFMLGRSEQALADLRESVRLRPGYFLAQHRLGLIHLAAGRSDEAALAFEAAVRDNPSFAEAQLGLAQALRASGDEAGARRAMESYSKLAGQSRSSPLPSRAADEE